MVEGSFLRLEEAQIQAEKRERVTCISVGGVGALQEHSQGLHHQPGQLLLFLCYCVVFAVCYKELDDKQGEEG